MPRSHDSLGLIETFGIVPAIVALDAASKAAMVSLLGYELARAGLVTIKVVGDVAASRKRRYPRGQRRQKRSAK